MACRLWKLVVYQKSVDFTVTICQNTKVDWATSHAVLLRWICHLVNLPTGLRRSHDASRHCPASICKQTNSKKHSSRRSRPDAQGAAPFSKAFL